MGSAKKETVRTFKKCFTFLTHTEMSLPKIGTHTPPVKSVGSLRNVLIF